MTTLTMNTILCWQEGDEDHEAPVVVVYAAHKGFPETRIDPAEPDSIEIHSITRRDGGEPVDFERWSQDDDLIAECHQHWAEERIGAAEYKAEYKAEMRAEARMMEGY